MLDILRRIAFVIGTIEIVIAPLWAVFGAGIFGSPLAEVEGRGWLVVIPLFVLAGPFSLLPAAILAKRWPRPVGWALLVGGLTGVSLASQPYGLGWAAWGLYVDAWVAVTGIALLTAAIGAGLAAAGKSLRVWLGVGATAYVTLQLSALLTVAIGMMEDAQPWVAHHPVSTIAFTPDGSAVVAAGHQTSLSGSSGSLTAFATRSGEVVFSATGTPSFALAERSGVLVGSGDAEGTTAWIAGSWSGRRLSSRATVLDVSSSGIVALRTADGVLAAYDGASGIELASRRDEPETRWISVAPDGRTVAIGYYDATRPIALWDIAAGTTGSIPKPATDQTLRAEWTPDGALLAVLVERTGEATDKLAVRLMDAKSGRTIADLAGEFVSGRPWFSPDRVLRTTRIGVPRPNQPPPMVTTLWNSADGSRIASFDDGALATWCPDGTFVGAGSWPATRTAGDAAAIPIERRSARDGSVIAEVGTVDFQPTELACSPDSRVVAVTASQHFVAGQERTRIMLLGGPLDKGDE